MVNIGYIIPLHKQDERVFNAIGSVSSEDKICITGPATIIEWISKCDIGRSDVSFIETNGSSYSQLVNAGIDHYGSDVDLISILEFDDVLTPNAKKIVNDYYNDWDNVEIFAPMACLVKYNDNEDAPILVGVLNESPMAPSVAEEFGYFDFNMMLRSNWLFVNGCYIRPSVFESHGKFKNNIEVFYDYEWSIRMIYNGCVIRSIPKATHLHGLYEDSAFESQRKLPKDIREKWLGVARREYFFDEDREISID